MKKAFSTPAVRQAFIILIILLMASVIFWKLVPYLTGVLGALTIFVIFKKWMARLVDKGWKPTLAAALIMVISFLGILLPVAGILLMLGKKIGNALGKSSQIFSTLKEQMEMLGNRIGYDFSSQIDSSAISSWAADNLKNFAGGAFTLLFSLAIMYFLLFYMLVGRRLLRESLHKYVPLSKKNLIYIGDETLQMIRANALGIPLVAIAQGIVALIGFFIFGVDKPFFWFVIVTISSMIPFAGTFVGLLPVFVIALASGNDFQAWGILIYGIVVVGSTDNIMRLYILKKIDDVHPLITLLGVVIGVPLFGFIGLIFGPLFISLFLLMARIYKREYGNPEV